jgi:hypothetical protein
MWAQLCSDSTKQRRFSMILKCRTVVPTTLSADHKNLPVQDSSREFLSPGRHRGECLPGAATLGVNRDDQRERRQHGAATGLQKLGHLSKLVIGSRRTTKGAGPRPSSPGPRARHGNAGPARSAHVALNRHLPSNAAAGKWLEDEVHLLKRGWTGRETLGARRVSVEKYPL